MRKLFILFALMCPIAAVIAQTPGTLDSTFNGNGRVFTSFPNSSVSMGFAMAILQSDKILLAGCANDTVATTNVHFAMARYEKDGTIDPTFGNGGFIKTLIGNRSIANCIAVQNDGKIILAGQSGDSKFTVARYDSLGVLDASFGNAGIVALALGSTDDNANAVCLQPDGKILLTGFSSDGSRNKVAVVRLLANGALDNLFNGNGFVTIPADSAGYSEGYAITLQPDSKILVAGTASQLGFVVRLLPNGSMDGTFGTGGMVKSTEAGVTDAYYAMHLENSGHILLGGTLFVIYKGESDFAILRLDSAGAVDTTYGNHGRAKLHIGPGHGGLTGIALQQNGQLVAAGNAGGAGTNNYAVVRFDADGTLDTFFGNGQGYTLTGGIARYQYPAAVSFQYDGKIVVAGRGDQEDPAFIAGFTMARYYGTQTTWGIEQHANSGITTVFPNPANEYISINTPSEKSEVDIMDIRGTVVMGKIQLAGSGKITLGNIAPGIYLLRIRDLESGSQEYKKIIKN